MANISDAYGKFHVDAEDLQLIGDEFAEFVDKFKASYYGIQSFITSKEEILDAVDNHEDINIEWSGCGKWAFERFTRYENGIVEFLFNRDKNADTANTLIKKVKDNDVRIDLSFTDNEPGCQVLYRLSGVIMTSPESGHLMYDVLEYTDYAYTTSNLLALDYADDYYDITVLKDQEALTKEVSEECKKDVSWKSIKEVIERDKYFDTFKVLYGDVYRIAGKIE